MCVFFYALLDFTIQTFFYSNILQLWKKHDSASAMEYVVIAITHLVFYSNSSAMRICYCKYTSLKTSM